MKQKLSKVMEEYPYIVAWGKMMGSFRYYIEEQCLRAQMDKADKNVTHYSDTEGKWISLSSLAPELQNDLELYKEGKKGGLI